jgi:hypothetical protein
MRREVQQIGQERQGVLLLLLQLLLMLLLLERQNVRHRSPTDRCRMHRSPICLFCGDRWEDFSVDSVRSATRSWLYRKKRKYRNLPKFTAFPIFQVNLPKWIDTRSQSSLGYKLAAANMHPIATLIISTTETTTRQHDRSSG